MEESHTKYVLEAIIKNLQDAKDHYQAKYLIENNTKQKDDALLNRIERESLKNQSLSNQRIARQFFLISNVVNYEQKKKKYNKRQRNLKSCFRYTNVIFLIAFYMFQIYTQEYPSEDLYNQFIDNQSKGIIEEIIVIHNSSQCPQEYENLFEYNWPGINFGCDCSQSLTNKNNQTNTKRNFLFHAICNVTQLNDGCKSLFEVKEKRLNLLNDNSFSKPFVLCSKRRQGVSLRYNFSYCQEQEKTICGSGSFTYCLPKNVDCPISQIGFTQQFNYSNLDQQNNSNYGKIFKVSKGLYFYYIKNETLMPISQIQMTETSEVCKVNIQNNISPNRSDYSLIKIRRQHCQLNDTQFKVVYNINEDQFFLANNLFVLKRQFKQFPINSSVIWTLQTKAYTLIKDSCQYDSNYENFLQKQNLQKIKSCRNALNIVIIVLILSLLINLLFTHLTKLKKKYKRNVCCYGRISLDCVMKSFKTFKFFIHLFIIICISVDFGFFDDQQNQFNSFVNSQCVVTELASDFYNFDQLGDSVTQFFLKIGILIIQCFNMLYLSRHLIKRIMQKCVSWRSGQSKQRRSQVGQERDS